MELPVHEILSRLDQPLIRALDQFGSVEHMKTEPTWCGRIRNQLNRSRLSDGVLEFMVVMGSVYLIHKLIAWMGGDMIRLVL